MKKMLLILLILCGCALMSEKDCQFANWNALGQKDSSEGLQSAKFFDRQKACAEHGISANHKQYKWGYRVGLKNYCTYENGITIGEENRYYNKICPKNLERDFLRGHRLGLKNLELEQLKEKESRTYRSRKKCFSSFDCKVESKCRKERCSYTGKSCFSDFDCDLESDCEDSRCIFIHND